MLNPLTNVLGDNLDRFTTGWLILEQLGISLFNETPRCVCLRYKGQEHLVVTDCVRSALINTTEEPNA